MKSFFNFFQTCFYFEKIIKEILNIFFFLIEHLFNYCFNLSFFIFFKLVEAVDLYLIDFIYLTFFFQIFGKIYPDSLHILWCGIG